VDRAEFADRLHFSDQTLRTASEGGTLNALCASTVFCDRTACQRSKRSPAPAAANAGKSGGAPVQCSFSGHRSEAAAHTGTGGLSRAARVRNPVLHGIRARRDRSALRRTPSPHVPAQISWRRPVSGSGTHGTEWGDGGPVGRQQASAVMDHTAPIRPRSEAAAARRAQLLNRPRQDRRAWSL